jgi:hypothetical protein
MSVFRGNLIHERLPHTGSNPEGIASVDRRKRMTAERSVISKEL